MLAILMLTGFVPAGVAKDQPPDPATVALIAGAWAQGCRQTPRDQWYRVRVDANLLSFTQGQDTATERVVSAQGNAITTVTVQTNVEGVRPGARYAYIINRRRMEVVIGGTGNDIHVFERCD